MTHYQQKLPPNTLEQIYDFIKECFIERIYYQIDENIDLIANVDETPIWMELKIENTISKIDEKGIRIKSFNLDQHRFSLVLCITAAGNKLPPMIVFRGKTGATLGKRLQKFVVENNYKILVVCQDKGLVDKNLFTKWLKEI